MIGGAHHRTGWRRRMGVGLLGVVALLAGSLPASDASAAAEGTGVVWPDATDWVRSVPYTFDVDLPGTTGELWVVVEGERTPIPSQGRASVDLTDASTWGTTRVRVEQCPSAGGDCEVVDVSPDLQLFDDLEIYLSDDRPYVGSEPNANRVLYRPTGTGTTRWQLLLADGSVAHTGQTAPGPDGWVTPLVPLGTPAQTGTLVLDVTLDAAGGFRLEKHVTYPARIDGVPPPAPVVTPEASEFYPALDYYRDEVDVVVDAPESVEVDLYARHTATGVTTHVTNTWQGGRVVIPFDGTTGRSEKSLPFGDYELYAISTDAFGQSSAPSAAARIRLRAEEVTTVRRTFRIRPAQVLVKTLTGRCGRLTRPGSRGRRGSIGLRSSASCRAPRSYVQGIFTAWLPRGVEDSWSEIRVDAVGGPARGHAGDDMVMALYTDKRRWGLEDLTTVHGRGTRRYRGPGIEGHYVGRVVHETDSGRPFVAWTAATVGDHQFDVDGFLLIVAYPDLRLPRG